MKCLARIALALAATAPFAAADLRLNPLFTDHAVLQHGMPVPIWGTGDAGEAVTVTIAGQTQATVVDDSGQWMVRLDPIAPGGPHQLIASAGDDRVELTDVLIGEVWLCSGQSNMDFTIARTEERYWCGVADEANVIAQADHPRIRQFKVALNFQESPVHEVAGGSWVVCSPATAGEFSAAAYFFARKLRDELPDDMPVGLLVSSYGASTAQTWTSTQALEANPRVQHLLPAYEQLKSRYDSGELQREYEAALAQWQQASSKARAEGGNEPRKPAPPRDPRTHQHNPSLLYNGMIAPLAPYAFRGAIWYQGESNGVTADIYLPLMQTLIADWRTQWRQPFPFIATQLASYRDASIEPQPRSRIAQVREAQRQTALTVPASAVAITIDIGDEKDVHPRNKQDVGLRLALLALSDVYGRTDIVSRGPEIIDAQRSEDGSIKLRLAHADGLHPRAVNKADARAVAGFAVIDAEGQWHRAEATIQGETISLRSNAAQPVEVAYGWADFPVANLFNAAGLPAGPFRVSVSP